MPFTQHLRYEVPSNGDSEPFGELARFVDRARAAGATDSSPVQAVPLDQDDSILKHLLIELDGRAAPRPYFAVDGDELGRIQDLLLALNESDGDVRGLMGQIAAVLDSVTGVLNGRAASVK